jgi:hypothetical protein
LAWSGLPVVTVRPTVFLEGFFLRLAAAGARDCDELALPLGVRSIAPHLTEDLFKLTGKTATSMHDFVKLHAAEFTRREATA